MTTYFVELTEEDQMNLLRAALQAPLQFPSELSDKLFPGLVFYFRQWTIEKGKQVWKEFLFSAYSLLVFGTGKTIKDVVCLNTGEVIRHEYQRALPEWLSCPLQRATVLANFKPEAGALEKQSFPSPC